MNLQKNQYKLNIIEFKTLIKQAIPGTKQKI